MANAKQVKLKTFSFTDDDIDLITFSLRKLSETSFRSLSRDSKDLILFIERMKKEKETENGK